jgi:hypothetical protein
MLIIVFQLMYYIKINQRMQKSPLRRGGFVSARRQRDWSYAS